MPMTRRSDAMMAISDDMLSGVTMSMTYQKIMLRIGLAGMIYEYYVMMARPADAYFTPLRLSA